MCITILVISLQFFLFIIWDISWIYDTKAFDRHALRTVYSFFLFSVRLKIYDGSSKCTFVVVFLYSYIFYAFCYEYKSESKCKFKSSVRFRILSLFWGVSKWNLPNKEPLQFNRKPLYQLYSLLVMSQNSYCTKSKQASSVKKLRNVIINFILKFSRMRDRRKKNYSYLLKMHYSMVQAVLYEIFAKVY